MHHRSPLRLLAGLAAALVTGAAGCSSGSSSPSSAALTTAMADSLGESVVSDVAFGVSGATSTGATTNFQTVSGADLSSPGFNCSVTRSPASPANSDSDRVVDSVRVTISGCVLSLTGETDTLKGTVDILDPTPTTTDHAIKRVFTDFGWVRVRTLSGRVTSALMSGTRMAVADSATITQTDSGMSTTYTFANGATATHVRDWAFHFAADTAGQIQPDSALPAGTWTVTGNSTWTRPLGTFDLAVSTLTPLHHDPACTVEPRLDAGELQAIVTRRGATSTVTVAFTGCGQFTVTRS